MRWLTWTVRFVLLLFLVALAAKNIDPVTVRFFFDVAVSAPLIVVVFAAFALGALFGVLALLGTLLRQRRQIGALKKQSAPAPAPSASGAPPI